MPTAHFIRVTAVALLLGMASVARATEPWADVKFSPKEGLELWLDASCETAAREAAGLGKLKSGDSLVEWHDASGARRHVRQSDSKKQPKFVQIGSADATSSSSEAGWVVRLDGEDDQSVRTRCEPDSGRFYVVPRCRTALRFWVVVQFEILDLF